MKKFAGCLLAALLLLGMSACAVPQKSAEPQPTAEPAVAETNAPAASAERVVAFNDDVLEGLVREALDKPTGDVTVADAEAVAELDFQMQGVDPDQPYIYNLDALRYFTNLTYLGLGYAVRNADDPAAAIDISPLAGLIKLESLQLGGLVIDDLSAVANMPNLMSLTVFGGKQLGDLTPLAGLTNLQALTLRGNAISDITPLSGLTNLRYLDAEDNQITVVSALGGLTKLERLFLASNPITDYSPLRQIRANLAEWDFEVPVES